MTVNWSPGYTVTLGIWVLLWFQRYLHLCDRIPSVAELGFVKPAHVPHERNLNIGVPHVLHVYLRKSLVLSQCLYDKSLRPSLPNKPTKAPLQDPVLVGLIHNLPINDPNCHDKKTATPKQAIAPFQVSFISFNPVSHVTSGIGLGFLLRLYGMMISQRRRRLKRSNQKWW